MTCPMCGKRTTWKENAWRPFCSERCQVLDLGLWAGERYRVPGTTLMVTPVEQDQDEEAPDHPPPNF